MSSTIFKQKKPRICEAFFVSLKEDYSAAVTFTAAGPLAPSSVSKFTF